MTRFRWRNYAVYSPADVGAGVQDHSECNGCAEHVSALGSDPRGRNASVQHDHRNNELA
jgi:hypothetical protein